MLGQSEISNILPGVRRASISTSQGMGHCLRPKRTSSIRHKRRVTMSMYNMTRGTHPLAPELMAILHFTKDDIKTIPRLRDIILFQDEIRILTRTGGNNREGYETGNEFLKNRPGYLRDWDDPFDSTYAWWAFEWPEDERETLQETLSLLKEKRPDLLFEDMEQITNHIIKRMEKA